MTPAEQARAMGGYISEHGFSPYYREPSVGPKCGCFARALFEVTGSHGCIGTAWNGALASVIGADTFNAEELIAAGYASDADRAKAVAACYRAAEMLEGA